MESSLLLVVWVAAILVLIVLSAFFSMSETAFTSVNQIKIKKMANEGNARAQRVLDITEKYDKFITTVLIGNNLVNIAATSIATVVFSYFLGGETGALATTIIMTLVLLIFSEITPKAFAKKNPERVCMIVCNLIHFVEVIFTPLSIVFTKLAQYIGKGGENVITEDELEVMIDEIQTEGVLEESESELIKSAMKLDDIKVADVYTPRVDVVAVEANVTCEEFCDVVVSTGFSRIPVYENSIDNIIGFISSKAFLLSTAKGEEFVIKDMMMPVKYFPESITVADALSDLQKSKIHMAVILDSYGGTQGIITMEDLLEELVGEIWDEDDSVQLDVNAANGGKFVVKGNANINDVMETIGIHFDPEGYEDVSVAGFIAYKLDRAPTKGDVADLENCTITVTNMRGRRVIDCELEIKEQKEQETNEEEAQ